MSTDKGKQILLKYLRNKTNPGEEILIEQWYKKLLDSGRLDVTDAEQEEVRTKMETRLMESIKNRPKTKVYRLPRMLLAAASVILVLTAGIFMYKQFNKIEPGSDKAILTLADGSTIELDKNAAGNLANQSGVSVRNRKSGWLEYFGASKNPGLNTLSIPRGGQYRLVLSDGTRVWINAETTLQYPTAFTGKTRKLKLSGEAFFEVVHDTAHPFVVELNGVNITVLGTSFNVMAYPEEKMINTTVATGLVGVSNKAQSTLVKSGQQAMYQNGRPMVISGVDVEEVIAWRQGLFTFNGMKLSAIAQQLSRWYKVEFEFKGPVPDEELYGIISRGEEISHVLEILEAAGHLHFETSGHTITVTSVKKTNN